MGSWRYPRSRGGLELPGTRLEFKCWLQDVNELGGGSSFTPDTGSGPACDSPCHKTFTLAALTDVIDYSQSHTWNRGRKRTFPFIGASPLLLSSFINQPSHVGRPACTCCGALKHLREPSGEPGSAEDCVCALFTGTCVC